MGVELFNRRNQVHRSIRPDNMYATGLDDSWIQFGDCVTVPPGWGQSPILETIEMGMTPMSGHGPSTSADDMYSLGVSILFLAMGHCPVVHMSTKDLIASKTAIGSFAALHGGDRPLSGFGNRYGDCFAMIRSSVGGWRISTNSLTANSVVR